jgi:Ca2+-binding EF-hand superfamily protein
VSDEWVLLFWSSRNLMVQLGGSSLSEHEIMTLARYYSDNQDNKMPLEALVSVAQEQLRRSNFENFAKLVESLLSYDTDRSGFVDAELVRKTCRAFHLPLPDDLVRALLFRMDRNAEGKVNYETFVRHLNWRDSPVSLPPYQPPPTKLDEAWTGSDKRDNVLRVNYAALLSMLFPESA